MSSGCCFCVLLYSFSHKLRIASIHTRRKDLSRRDAALGSLCPHDYGLSALLVHSFKFPSGGRKALIFHTEQIQFLKDSFQFAWLLSSPCTFLAHVGSASPKTQNLLALLYFWLLCFWDCSVSLVCVYEYMYMYVYIHIFLCMCIWVKACVHTGVYTCVCVYVYVFICTCVSIYVYMYVCACVYAHVCLHTHAHTRVFPEGEENWRQHPLKEEVEMFVVTNISFCM